MPLIKVAPSLHDSPCHQGVAPWDGYEFQCTINQSSAPAEVNVFMADMLLLDLPMCCLTYWQRNPSSWLNRTYCISRAQCMGLGDSGEYRTGTGWLNYSKPLFSRRTGDQFHPDLRTAAEEVLLDVISQEAACKCSLQCDTLVAIGVHVSLNVLLVPETIKQMQHEHCKCRAAFSSMSWSELLQVAQYAMPCPVGVPTSLPCQCRSFGNMASENFSPTPS